MGRQRARESTLRLPQIDAIPLVMGCIEVSCDIDGLLESIHEAQVDLLRMEEESWRWMAGVREPEEDEAMT